MRDIIQVNPKEIDFDEQIYPRLHINQQTVIAYTESLKCGADFPPVLIQKVKDDNGIRIIGLDGKHRTLAHIELNRKEISAINWKKDTLDLNETLNDLRIESVKRNLIHGDRLTNKDKERMCKMMATEDKKGLKTQEWFAEQFGVHQTTIGEWIGDIRAEQEGPINDKIIRLHLLGWTDLVIANRMGYDSERSVANIRKNMDFHKIADLFKDGTSLSDIARIKKLSLNTVRGIVYQEMSDKKKMEELDIDIQLYNIWNIQNRDERFGDEYPGNTPGQIMANLIYYYTKPKDIVLDPMAGGAVTPDICLVMDRECRAYDIRWGPKYKDETFRPEVIQNDILKGLPNDLKPVDFIYLDPPYFNIMGDDYPKNAFTESYEGFLKAMDKVFSVCVDKLKKTGKIAFIMKPINKENTGGEWYDTTFDCCKIAEKHGLKIHKRIAAPLSTQQFGGAQVNQVKEKNVMLNTLRDIVIFERK